MAKPAPQNLTGVAMPTAMTTLGLGEQDTPEALALKRKKLMAASGGDPTLGINSAMSALGMNAPRGSGY